MAKPNLWNPLVCGGTPLPLPFVLTIKLIAGATLLSGGQTHWALLAPIAIALLSSAVAVPAAIRAFLAWACVLGGAAALCVPGVPSLYGYAALVSALAIVEWPKEMTVIYDADCGICNASRRFWHRVDFERAYDWRPFQSGVGKRWNIPIEALRERAHFIADDGVSAGFRAVKRIFLYNPATYFLMLLAVAAPPDGWILYRQIVAPLALFVFTRPFEPIGEAAYMWVARNRYRLSSEGACALPPKQ